MFSMCLGQSTQSGDNTMDPTTIDALPDEVLEYIFLQLLPYGEIQSCRLVCRVWHRIANGALSRLQQLLLRCSNFQWFLLQSSSVPGRNIAERCSHASAFCRGSVFIFGGCTASYTTFNDLWKFELDTRTWTRLLPTGSYPTPKACATMIAHNDTLVLFGGWSKSSPNPIHQTTMFFNELHVYDPEMNLWTQVHSASEGPHLAGHSASVAGDCMIVFGGSHGSGSSNTVWTYNFTSCQWSTPSVAALKPQPRYGQSQIKIDESHILIVGGCAGPNLIFSDVWLLTVNLTGEWQWEEIRVEEQRNSAPQIWSHPACRLGNRVLVLSRPPRRYYQTCSNRDGATLLTPSVASEDSSLKDSDASCSSGQSSPSPSSRQRRRRLLISSRSLDEHTPPMSPQALEKASQTRKLGELQRAKSIPTIIVGEIPTLVVTGEECSEPCEQSPEKMKSSGTQTFTPCSHGGHASVESPENDRKVQQSGPSPLAMAASSLIPHQAVEISVPTHVLPSVHFPPTIASSSMRCLVSRKEEPAKTDVSSATNPSEAGGNKMYRNTPYPSVKPNASKNRARQLEMLNRMENYIRCHCRENSQGSSNGDGGSGEQPTFKPSSPPPNPSTRLESENVPLNPMHIYLLDVESVLSTRSVRWFVDEQSSIGAPEDTILYSLVKARGELVLFGGLRNTSLGTANSSANLDVIAPIHNAITNETYIIRPEIAFG